MENVIAATTPSTLTPTYEVNSPQVSRKNSLVTGNRPALALEEVHQPQQRETVIRFQLENEVTSGELMKSDVALAVAGVSGEMDSKSECSSKLGQLYFKVR